MIKLIFLSLLLALTFQNCVGTSPVKFFNLRQSLKSEMGAGGSYDGKPTYGYYCRIYDHISCQAQVQNLQGMVKVDSSGIHLIQDSCTSTSVNFLADDSTVEFSALAPNFLSVSRGIFKKCDVDSNTLPLPVDEMTDAYCVSDQDNMAVVLNKNLKNNAFSFDLSFKNNSQLLTVRGDSVIKSKGMMNDNYASESHEFDLKIISSDSQTAKGHLQVVIDDRPFSLDLSCRTASATPTLIIEKDLEISPTWIDTTRLVGYWKLNESKVANGSVVLDSSNYATHGTLLNDNGSLIKSDPSVIGGSLFFDGNNDSVDIPQPADSHLAFGMRSFTYMVWIKKTGNAGTFDMPLWLGGNSSVNPGYDIECGSVSTGCMALISDGLGQSTSIRTARFTSNASTLIGRWVLLTAVVDRDLKQFRAYLDGALVSTTDISMLGPINPSYNLRIGSTSYMANFFMGSIDDVAIWNGALPEQEIKEIFQRLRPKFY